MDYTFWFVLVLIAVAVLGRRNWDAIRAFLRRSPSPSNPAIGPLKTSAMCPRCGEGWNPSLVPPRCLLCGWPSAGPSSANPTKALAHLLKRLKRYQELGLLSAEVCDRLRQAIDGEIQMTLAIDEARAKARLATPPDRPTTVPEPEYVLEFDTPKAASPIPEPASPERDIPQEQIAARVRSGLSALHAKAEPVPPARPARDYRALMTAFLEESNIRWGEIVGGLLIVGCSLALVISFWSSISERPLLKFGLFNGVTALIFTLGFHAERRWKLPSTATGLLLIGTLLTPLNFLAVASLGRGVMTESAWGIAGEVASVLLFSGLIYQAGRSLVSRAAWTLFAGVLIPSIFLLVVRRWINPSSGTISLLSLGAVPLLSQMIAVGGLMIRSRRDPEDQQRGCHEMLRLLGPATFACALAMGLMISRGGSIAETLHRMAPLAPLAGLPALAAGLWLWRKTTEETLVGYRTAGASIASGGILLMLAGVALAWPSPMLVIPVALLNFAILSGMAVALNIPAAHVLAGLCLTLSYLMGWSVVTGSLSWTEASSPQASDAMLSGRSGAALVPLVLLFGTAAGASVRVGRRLNAQAFSLVATMAGLFSLALVTWHGFGRSGDPVGATWVYGIYALTAIVAAEWFGRYPLVSPDGRTLEAWVLAWIGSALGLAGLVQGFVFGGLMTDRQLPWTAALLTHAALAVGLSSVLSRTGWLAMGTILGKVMNRSALATSGLAAVGLVVAIPAAPSSVLGAQWLGLGVIWLALAWRFASPWLFDLCQAAVAGAGFFFVATVLHGRAWFAASPHPWLDPWFVQAQAMGLGAMALAWIGVRLAVLRSIDPGTQTVMTRRSTVALSLLDPRRLSVDRGLRGMMVLALVALALYGVIPGVAQELTPLDMAADLGSDSGSTLARVVPPSSTFEVLAIPHRHALGAGSWAVLGLSIVVLLAGQWERFRRVDLIAAMVAASLASPLWAGRWEADVAVASALRWASAAVLMGLSAMIWARRPLGDRATRWGWRMEGDSGGMVGLATGSAIVLTIVPLAAVTAFVVASSLAGHALVGPDPGSFFARSGVAGSYLPPMLVVVGTLVGFAVREHSSRFALAASLVLNLAATAGYLLVASRGGLAFDLALASRLALLNAIAGSCSALTWIGSVAVWRQRFSQSTTTNEDGRLSVLVGLNNGLVLLVVIAGTVSLWLDPLPGSAQRLIAGPWGWAALGLAAGSGLAWSRTRGRSLSPEWMGLGLLVLAVFLAMGMVFRDSGNWLTYHGVLAGQALAGVAILLTFWQRSRVLQSAIDHDTRNAMVRWATVTLIVVVAFALRSYRADPQSPWWAVGGLVVAAGMAPALAACSGRLAFLPIGALLLNLATTLGWLEAPGWRGLPGGWSALIDVNVIALALPAPLWLWIDRRLKGLSHGKTMPFGRLAAWLALLVCAGMIGLGLAGDAARAGSSDTLVLEWLALGATGFAMAAGLWDLRATGTMAGLYVLGLCVCGLAVHGLHLAPQRLVWTGTMILAAYSVGASYLWSRREGLRAVADRLRVPRPIVEAPFAGLSWLVPASLMLAACVVALAFGSILTDPNAAIRASAANAVLAQGLAIGLLARGDRRVHLQLVALCGGVLGVVALGWTGIAPNSPNGLLDRLSAVAVALFAASAVYGIVLSKVLPRATEWVVAARRLVPVLVVLGGLVLLGVIGVEVMDRFAGRTPLISVTAIFTLALSIVGAASAALIAALVPGRDPLGLSEKGRTAYVYGCESLIAALIVHLRLTIPWLFSGILAQYGPLIVMGVAFVGVGLGEVFRRQKRMVLAEPLERTGAILPVLPLLGAFWATPRPGEDVLFLVLIGGLYTMLALLRSSTGFGALAAVAFNVAIWSVLGRWRGYGILEHPQIWLIPPSLCVLAGVYLNRDRLSDAQAATIRYVAALAIYLSSTADILLTGVAQAPWLPLVLGGLAILGIFSGLLLRVRGFLYLGVGFLLLSLFSILWYAAVDLRQTWIWAATGIVAGGLILAVFAFVEKKKTEVLRVVEQLKGWES